MRKRSARRWPRRKQGIWFLDAAYGGRGRDVEPYHRLLRTAPTTSDSQAVGERAAGGRLARIVPVKSGTGRCVAAEILIGNRTVREFIELGKSFKDIVKLIEEGHDQYGMQP